MSNQNNLNKKPDGNVTLAIVVGFVALSLIFEIPILTYLALAVGFGSLLSTTIQRSIIFVWEKIAKVIGTVNSYLLLSIIFFIFLTPIALLMKLLNNKDSLRLKKPKDSNFFERNFKFKKEDLVNIW
jgi:cellulose synthase/poly-beta-1,6-N-acetylglucosamine synthase-like glycosyltransferase